MAEGAVMAVVEPVLKMLVSLAADEFRLAWGMEKDLEKLSKKLKDTLALLSNAQTKQITSEYVQGWLKNLQSFALDAQIVLDDFGYQVLRQKIETRKRDKVQFCFSFSNPLFSRPKMAHKIKYVLSSFEEIYDNGVRNGLVAPHQMIYSLPECDDVGGSSTVPYVEDSEIVGRDDDVSEVVTLLTSTSYNEGEEDLPVITILGMGGQGKTTLAQLVYKSDRVKSYFDATIWICVSNDFNVKRLLAEMQSLSQPRLQDHASNDDAGKRSPTHETSKPTTTQELVEELKKQLSGKRFLLVLDNVWNKKGEEWRDMRACLLQIGGFKGSKILATTRNEDVASAMRTSWYHRLGTLSEEESWKLFEKCAFGEGGATKSTPALVDIGRKILKRCGGVPLAIRTIGGSLYSKNSESEWSIIENSEMWSTYSRGDTVLAAIKLSYDHLPSWSVKQCFAYCAIFEKDTVMKKDQLIQLWMAQGLLNPPPQENGLQMEDIGSMYLNILLRNSLFQDAENDPDNNITTCKMHDLVHDVSLQVSNNYLCHVQDWEVKAGNQSDALHMSISLSKEKKWGSLAYGPIPRLRLQTLDHSSNLQTLQLKDVCLPKDWFIVFRCLSVSVLIIAIKYMEELPNSIGEMKRLRFLDIIDTEIKRLPKSFTKLYYLQTLRVGCLEKLPKGFENLINLRHIHVNGGSLCLCPGLDRLKNLQTCEIEPSGSRSGDEIEISQLQNVRSSEFASKFNLSKKPNIRSLHLLWDDHRRRREDCADVSVMEGLKPHPNLEVLSVEGYGSPNFPSWIQMGNGVNVMFLCNLVELKLCNLDQCETLPSLGHLPCLLKLVIYSLHKVKCIGREFYGWSNPEWATKSSNNGSNNYKEPEIIRLFPALRELTVKNMKSLVGWSDAMGIMPAVPVDVFPCLEVIRMWDLPNLSVFPNLGSLRSLRELSAYNCNNLAVSGGNWNGGRLGVSLRELIIEGCEKLKAPFICSLLSSLGPIETLSISCDPSLWPKDLHHLTSLRELHLRAGNDSKKFELDCLPWPYLSTHDSVSLTSLKLDGGDRLPKVKYLPDQIQYVTTLTSLTIWCFDELEALPEWLGKLEGLRQLEIWDCEKLKELPSAETFQRLTNLQKLSIRGCPLLEESDSELSKIAYIPKLELD